MRATPWLQKPIWMGDNRTGPRWIDPRTALVRVRHQECLAKVRDMSLGGASLSLLQVHPAVGDEMDVDVAFETNVLPFRGRVVHAKGYSWGSVVGIEFDGDEAASREFLSRRYQAGPG